MTEQELKDLKHRCKQAAFYGHDIAKAGEFAADLMDDGASKPSCAEPAPWELLKMVAEVEGFHEGEPQVDKGVHPYHVVVNVELGKPEATKVVTKPVKMDDEDEASFAGLDLDKSDDDEK